GYVSMADGHDFFLAKNGKEDPQAELEAFIRQVFETDDHPTYAMPLACRFPARLLFLMERLQLPAAMFPNVQCNELLKFLNYIKADKVSIMFATAHVTSPASMYGHTFLRLWQSNMED